MYEIRRFYRRLRHNFIIGLKHFLRGCYRFGISVKRTWRGFLAWLGYLLESFYRLGRPMCIFIASATVFVLVGIVLLIAVPSNRKRKAEAYAAEAAALATPRPTAVTATATPEPTPEPTPEEEGWIVKGAEGEDVIQLQTRLMELGYLDIDEPTDHFGNATQYAVKLFQRQHDLQQDGIFGQESSALLYSDEAQPYVMKEGAEGDDIRSFQEQLVELGYLSSKQVTGYYGTDTVNAVKKFQNRNYLSKDGKAGEKTMEAVNSPDARVSYTKEQEVVKAKKAAAKAAKASSSSGRIDKMIGIASQQIGKTYVLGSNGPSSFDCSGLVYYCLRQVGVYTRRLNAAGFSRTTSWAKVTSMGALKRGDLIFFKSDGSSTVGHVAIYIGSGMMIDASSSNGKVMKRSCTGSWSRRNFVCGRRPIG